MSAWLRRGFCRPLVRMVAASYRSRPRLRMPTWLSHGSVTSAYSWSQNTFTRGFAKKAPKHKHRRIVKKAGQPWFLEALVLDAKSGEVKNTNYDMARLHVHPRDIAAMRNEYTARQSVPLLLPRENCILVNLSHVKAIIHRDHVVFLDSHRMIVRRTVDNIAAFLRSDGRTFDLNHGIDGDLGPLEEPEDDDSGKKKKKKKKQNKKGEDSQETESRDLEGAEAAPEQDTQDHFTSLISFFGGTPFLSESTHRMVRDGSDEKQEYDAWVQQTRSTQLIGITDKANPFEFRVLESILALICRKYDQKLECFSFMIQQVLSSDHAVAGTPVMDSGVQIRDMLPLQNSLAEFERNAKDMSDKLEEVIQDDEDMVDMFLTAKSKAPGGKLMPDYDHAQIELLLERYHRELSSIGSQGAFLRKRIIDRQELLQIALDDQRNRIINANLVISMFTAGCASASVLTGMFGMNLLSGFEEVGGLFPVACMGALSMGAMTHIFLRSVYVKEPSKVDLLKLSLARNATRGIGDVQDALLDAVGNNKRFDRDTVGAVLQVASERKLTPREVDHLFGHYDKDEDGWLNKPELMRLMCDLFVQHYRTH